MNAKHTPGMRAIRAAQKLFPAPENDNRTLRAAAIIDAEFADMHAKLSERMACAGCGGLFRIADLLPASAHPEADPVCERCLSRDALLDACRRIVTEVEHIAKFCPPAPHACPWCEILFVAQAAIAKAEGKSP